MHSSILQHLLNYTLMKLSSVLELSFTYDVFFLTRPQATTATINHLTKDQEICWNLMWGESFLDIHWESTMKNVTYRGQHKRGWGKKEKATGGLGNSNYAINHTGSLNSERVASAIRETRGGEGLLDPFCRCVQGKKSHPTGSISQESCSRCDKEIFGMFH